MVQHAALSSVVGVDGQRGGDLVEGSMGLHPDEPDGFPDLAAGDDGGHGRARQCRTGGGAGLAASPAGAHRRARDSAWMLVFPNGNAMQLDFTAQAGSALYVVYTRTFIKAGDVDESSAHAVLRDPSISGVKVSDDQDPKRPGHPGHLAIPFDRLQGKPQVKAP